MPRLESDVVGFLGIRKSSQLNRRRPAHRRLPLPAVAQCRAPRMMRYSMVANGFQMTLVPEDPGYLEAARAMRLLLVLAVLRAAQPRQLPSKRS